MNRIKKSVVAAGLSAGMIGGGAAGVVFGSPLALGAQESSTTVPSSSDTTAPSGTSDTTAPSSKNDAASTDKQDNASRSAERLAKRTEHLQSTLEPLVKAGTITQTQADAVVKAFLDAAPPKDGMRRGGFDGPPMGRGFFRAGVGLEALSDLLDATPAELGKLMADGQTLAQIAESKGVAPQKVIDTLVAATKKGLDEAVESGRTTQEEADKRLTEATKRITDGVNKGFLKPGRHGAGPFGGHRGENAPDAGNGDAGVGDAPAPPTTGD
ncbi:MAG: hypothetical protein WBA45_14410 [Microthrixaceae bacterium]